MTQTLSAHRILAELKIIGDRIQTATREPFVGFRVGDEGTPQGFKSVQEFEERAKAKWQAVNDLIKRRDVLKAALIASNAAVDVTVAGVTMKVAEAIDRKDAIEHKSTLLYELRRQYASAVSSVEAGKRNLDAQINKRIEDSVAGKDRSKLDPQDEENIIKMAKKRYEPHFVDPIKTQEQIDKMLEEIQSFQLEVDTALSEINARTMIEIPE